MQRDMDLFRKIALYLETINEPVFSSAIEIVGYDTIQICYHCELMDDAGLISVPNSEDYDGICNKYIDRLTNKGHDFIDAARSDTIWQKAKTEIGKTVGGVSLGVLVQLLKHYGQSLLGLPEI